MRELNKLDQLIIPACILITAFILGLGALVLHFYPSKDPAEIASETRKEAESEGLLAQEGDQGGATFHFPGGINRLTGNIFKGFSSDEVPKETLLVVPSEGSPLAVPSGNESSPLLAFAEEHLTVDPAAISGRIAETPAADPSAEEPSPETESETETETESVTETETETETPTETETETPTETETETESETEPPILEITVTAKDIKSKGFRAAVQNALNRIKDPKISGLYVKVAPGKYEFDLSQPLYLRSGTTLDLTDVTLKAEKGMSHSLIRCGYSDDRNKGYYYHDICIKGGVIDCNGNKEVLPIRMAHAENIRIENMTFRNSENNHYCEFAGVRNLEIVGCTFRDLLQDTDHSSEAIQLDIPSETHFPGYLSEPLATTDVTITECSFKNVSIAIGSHTAILNLPYRKIRIEENEFIGCRNSAVNMQNWSEVTIRGNRITESANGIQILNVGIPGLAWGTITADSDEFRYKNEKNPVSCEFLPEEDRKILVEGNLIRLPANETEGSAIKVYGSNYQELVVGADMGGSIPIGNYCLSGITICNNEIYSGAFGIRVRDSVGLSITDNLISTAETDRTKYTFGIRLSEDSEVSEIRGNQITAEYGIPIYAEQAEIRNILWNTLSCNSDSEAIFLCDHVAVGQISENMIESDCHYGIYLLGQTNAASVIGNRIMEKSESGIVLSGSHADQIRDNYIAGSVNAVTLIEGSSADKIEGISGTNNTGVLLFTDADSVAKEYPPEYLVKMTEADPAALSEPVSEAETGAADRSET